MKSIALRQDVSSTVIAHPKFETGVLKMRSIVEDALSGLPPSVTFMMGPSRCGKTEIVNAIAREFPDTCFDGKRSIPVLVVYVRSSMGPKDLPAAVIAAMGLPVPRTGRVGELSSYMVAKLALANVKVIFFDEASHVVEPGARIQPYAASDWFKDAHFGFNLSQAHKQPGFSLVLTGVPRLQRLLDANPQLRNRADKPLTILPYRWDNKNDRNDFAGCVQAFLTIFADAGHENTVLMNEFLRDCYIASAGLIGMLSKFFDKLATLLAPGAPITLEVCRRAAGLINLPGDGVVLPFSGVPCEDSHLLRVLTSELQRYDLLLPREAALA